MDWQTQYELQDTPWDKSHPHPALRDFIAENGPLPGRILVPGCGRGHDARALSAHGNQVIGLDIAPAATEAANAFPKIANEQFLLGDFFNLAPEFDASFDWLIEHTCFCAIDPAMRSQYARAAARTLRPGGHFLAIFFLTPDVEQGPPFPASISELDTLFTPFFNLRREWSPAHTFAGRESRELLRLYQLNSHASRDSARLGEPALAKD